MDVFTPDVLRLVLSHLKTHELLRASVACKQWHRECLALIHAQPPRISQTAAFQRCTEQCQNFFGEIVPETCRPLMGFVFATVRPAGSRPMEAVHEAVKQWNEKCEGFEVRAGSPDRRKFWDGYDATDHMLHLGCIEDLTPIPTPLGLLTMASLICYDSAYTYERNAELLPLSKCKRMVLDLLALLGADVEAPLDGPNGAHFYYPGDYWMAYPDQEGREHGDAEHSGGGACGVMAQYTVTCTQFCCCITNDAVLFVCVGDED